MSNKNYKLINIEYIDAELKRLKFEYDWASTRGGAYYKGAMDALENLKERLILPKVTKSYNVKEKAISFAKFLMKKKLHRGRSMYDTEIYWPKQYNAMLGELAKNGDKLYKEFINAKNDE